MKTKLILLMTVLLSFNSYAEENCEETHGPGFVWGNAENRCILSTAAASATGNAEDCDKDKDDRDAYAKCLSENVVAEGNTEVQESEDKMSDLGTLVPSLITTSVGIYGIVRMKKLKACGVCCIGM